MPEFYVLLCTCKCIHCKILEVLEVWKISGSRELRLGKSHPVFDTRKEDSCNGRSEQCSRGLRWYSGSQSWNCSISLQGSSTEIWDVLQQEDY